jgi:hypothetical protein
MFIKAKRWKKPARLRLHVDAGGVNAALFPPPAF